MPSPSLGLIMILRDEAANLPRSLAPVAACFDEVVVVDTGSRDATPDLAASLGARVHHLPWGHDFAAARNHCIAQARADWLFWLDGDNGVAPGDVLKLRDHIPGDGPAVLWAMEQVVPSGGRLWQKRCFPRLPEVGFKGRIHEQLMHPPQWPAIVTPVVVSHWGYSDPQRNLEKGRYYLGLLEQSLDEDPGDFYALFQAARCHLNLRQFHQAAVKLAHLARQARARQANPELWVHAHGLWSQALERLGRPQEAVDILDQMLEEMPDHGLAQFLRGRLAYSLGDWEMAARRLEMALGMGLGAPMVDLDPDKTLFLAEYFLGRALGRLGRAAQSQLALSRAVERDPQSLAARTDLARVLMGLGREQDARDQLNHVLEIRPGDRQARDLLAQLERAA